MMTLCHVASSVEERKCSLPLLEWRAWSGEAVGLPFFGIPGVWDGKSGGCMQRRRILKLPASVMPSMEVALCSGGRQKSLYQSGRSTSGMLRVVQKCSRSSGTLRFTVCPLVDADKQKGNFQSYTMVLALNKSSKGLSSLLLCNAMLDRSRNILISVP